MFKLRAPHSAVASYRTRHGVLPNSLEAVCEDDTYACRLDAPERWLQDAWGTTIAYRAAQDAYQLTSAGPDKLFGTADDIAFDSFKDLAQAERLAGCYRLTMGLTTLDTTMLHLSTRIGRSGGYLIESPKTFANDTAFIAEWHPLGTDSILARWIRVDRGMTLRAHLSNGMLTGKIGSQPLRGISVSCLDP